MKVVWKGFFEGDTGYIVATRQYVAATELAGLKTSIMPLQPLQANNPLNKYIMPIERDDLVILHQIPTVSPREQAYFTVTEFDIPPHEWWIPLSQSKLILTQSKFCRESFSKIPGIDKNKIKIVNFVVPQSLSPKGDTIRDTLIYNKPMNDYACVFGSIFEWVSRKKPELMWQAFTEEFDKNEDVLFLNKMSIPQGFRSWKKQFNKYQQADPRILLVNKHLDDIGTFYRSLDGYVSPTAGEGWGATLIEAMACGTPTIGSNHGGNLDYMNNKNSWLVDTGPWEYIGNDPTNKLWMVHDYQRWKLPEVASIRKAMREIYELKQEGKVSPRVIEGLKVKEQFSIDKVALQLSRAINT